MPVAALGAAEGRAPIAVPDFAQLAGLARFLERPILYEVQNGNRTYAVDDESIRYLTRAADRREARIGTEEASPDARALRKQVASSEPKRRLSKRALAARGAAGLVVLAVLTTLTLSFTASTNVPASRVGTSVQPGQVMQAAPANCGGLALTSLLRGSGTFSNSASHVLILGSAGVDRITSTGQYNCIVGGGGKDTVNAKSTDVCIIGPTAGTTYNTCLKKT